MLSTEFPTIMVVRLEQRKNAEVPMLVTGNLITI